MKGKPCIYSMRNRGPRNDHWGISCFNVPKLEKKFEFYYMIVLEFCLPQVKQHMNQTAVLELCTNVIIWGQGTSMTHIK